MSQTIRTKKTDVEYSKINELLDDIQEKYKISKDVLLKYIDQARIDYQLDFYKIDIQMVEDEIDAINMNENGNTITEGTVNEALKKVIEREQKEYEENHNIKINSTKKDIKQIEKKDLLRMAPSPTRNEPAQKYIIPTNSKINVKYNTTIMYNLGNNEMEKEFNIENPSINESLLQTIPTYDLLPKDQSVQKDGYEKYFSETKKKLMEELNINPDDSLLGISKFFLFVAFDVIDAKPTFDDLIGIDPLNDYKKYILKVNQNMNNLFFVSGQIIYVEGNLIENGTIIEVRNFRNGFEINEYSINYDQIRSFYEKSRSPYAIYSMNGPYFSKDTIDLTVFKQVIRQVAIKNPHFFIVNGPFFSSENEKVKSGEVDTEEGMKNVINLLKSEFKGTRTKILICPGISDIENFYPVPQPPFDKVNNSFIESPKNGEGEIYFISNPQIISINEAFLGDANFDSIKDIIFNSIHSEEINTVDKACEMILYQKNFYPVLPNTIQLNYENNQEKIVTVDLCQNGYLNIDKFDSTPDIILINSLMKNFAKKIHGTVFINSSSFIKGKNYGEIAKITLHDPSKDTDINKRVKVEFIKINAINNTGGDNKK
jgi:hypothetical protein